MFPLCGIQESGGDSKIRSRCSMTCHSHKVQPFSFLFVVGTETCGRIYWATSCLMINLPFTSPSKSDDKYSARDWGPFLCCTNEAALNSHEALSCRALRPWREGREQGSQLWSFVSNIVVPGSKPSRVSQWCSCVRALCCFRPNPHWTCTHKFKPFL